MNGLYKNRWCKVCGEFFDTPYKYSKTCPKCHKNAGGTPNKGPRSTLQLKLDRLRVLGYDV